MDDRRLSIGIAGLLMTMCSVEDRMGHRCLLSVECTGLSL
jgi:hypothetical protein